MLIPVIGKIVGSEVRIHAGAVAEQQVLRVRIVGARQLAFRVQIARWLIEIASRVVGCNVQIIEM